MTSPRISVIIPTYQRREVVLQSVRSLAQQEFPETFEVIVVVDGSQDGSAEALRKLDTPFPLRVIEQPNQGAATARNRGAAEASGEILLFLDDDMVSHPQLLAEHDRSHHEGADVVLGHVPLHPETPRSILTQGVKDWADRRAQRLSSPGAKLTLQDLLTGQISIHLEAFRMVGGFDTSFTAGGSFGNEDVDFGYRLLLAGCQIIFNPKAISWQYYVVQPRQYLRQWHQAGLADVVFTRKHPEKTRDVFLKNGSDLWVNRFVWRRVVAWPVIGNLILFVLRGLVLTLLERGFERPTVSRLFRQIKKAEYWRGVQKGGGIPEAGPLRVLAYHAIADLSGVPRLEPYGMPLEAFKHQMDSLLRAGYHFVSGSEVIRFLHHGAGLPRRAVLLTFDDCYEELLAAVLPILQERRIPAVVFAVSAYVGDTNRWDREPGVQPLRLLDANGLRRLEQAGVEIGAHSRTHLRLIRLPVERLPEEIAGSLSDLESLGLQRPQLFSYPYGECRPEVRQAVHASGLKAAFTIDPGLAYPGHDPYQVPRIEILRADTGWKFLRKVARAGESWPSLKSFRRLPIQPPAEDRQSARAI